MWRSSRLLVHPCRERNRTLSSNNVMYLTQINLLTNDTGGIFNWHPLLMTLAFPVLMGEAVLAYRAPVASNLDRSLINQLPCKSKFKWTAGLLGSCRCWSGAWRAQMGLQLYQCLLCHLQGPAEAPACTAPDHCCDCCSIGSRCCVPVA